MQPKFKKKSAYLDQQARISSFLAPNISEMPKMPKMPQNEQMSIKWQHDTVREQDIYLCANFEGSNYENWALSGQNVFQILLTDRP